VTIPEAAELLGRSVPDVRRAAREVEPYRHADGSARWPLRELARVLADGGGVRELGLLVQAGSSICRKSAYGHEGIALILLGAEDRVGYSSLWGR
jgi:hypothetical protein